MSLHTVFRILISVGIMVGVRCLQKLKYVGAVLNVAFGLAHACFAYFLLNVLIFHDLTFTCGGMNEADPIWFWTIVIVLSALFIFAHTVSMFELKIYNDHEYWQGVYERYGQ
jgi:hypothetical protein